MRYYRLQGREVVPCDMEAWSQALSDIRPRRIGYWHFKSCYVSTVFLGVDHRFSGGDPPILFETMVFGGPFDEEMVRYSTYDEAEAGHMRYCKMIREFEAHAPWRQLKRLRNQKAAENRKLNKRMAMKVKEGT